MKIIEPFNNKFSLRVNSAYTKIINRGFLQSLCVFLILCVISPYVYSQTNSTSNSTSNQEVIDYNEFFQITESESLFDFYQGVNLYNTGYIAESIIAFQRAISLHNRPLYQYMYARASRAYGLESQSRFIYETLLNQGYLQNFIRAELEFLRLKNRIGILPKSLNQIVRNSSLDLTDMGYRLPMTIRTLPDGNLAVVFLKSNDIIVISPTGNIEYELGTNLSIINRPFDVIFTDEKNFLVTSFTDDKIYQFNERGSLENKFFDFERDSSIEIPYNVEKFFLGPQYMVQGDSGNIYVTVYGSGRVFKFSSQGEYLFDFGIATHNFRGLNEPSGIEFIDNRLVVADYISVSNENVSKLYSFDLSGNFLTETDISNERIESLRLVDDDYLLIATETHVIKYDYKKRTVIEDFTQAEFEKIVNATFDKNNILWVVDQGRNRIETFGYLENQYTGLDSRIISVNSDRFPNIEVTLTVSSAFGEQIIGLNSSNFTVFENNQTISQIEAIPTNEFMKLNENIVIIPSVYTFLSDSKRGRIEESLYNLVAQGQELNTSEVRQVYFWLLPSKGIPAFSISQTSYAKEIENAIESYQPEVEDEGYLFQSIRYAINTLLPLPGKKTIVIAGALPSHQSNTDFGIWDQIEGVLSFYNIGIVWINDSLVNDVPSYFSPLLKGNAHNSLQTNYLDGSILEEIFNFLNFGNYVIRYRTPINQDFNRKFIPMEIEVNFFSSSGKDILGYVAPGWEDE